MADQLILVNGVAVGINYLRANGGSVINTATGVHITLYNTLNSNTETIVEQRNCCCGGVKQEVKYIVCLRFEREQLLYDIKNYSYVESDKMEDLKKGVDIDINHAKHLTADVGEEGNIDRVNRHLPLRYMEAVEMLYPFTNTTPEAEDIDDKIIEPDEYVIQMIVPENMSRTTLILLSHQVHEYLVSSVMADWLGITNPEASAEWQRKFDYIKEQINLTRTRRRKEAFTRKMFP